MTDIQTIRLDIYPPKPRVKSRPLRRRDDSSARELGMALPRKLFRIEQMGYDSAPAPVPPSSAAPLAAVADGDAAQRHSELIAEIKSLQALMGPRSDDAQRLIESYRTQVAEIRKIKDELVIIHDAIDRTKHEIATLHVTGFHSDETRVTHQLDAVVAGTEQATQTILNMVEDIDQFATTLIETGQSDAEKSLGRAIQDRVVRVFEACNFQDITGQRISKVVNTWKFIESHVAHMMEIWGGAGAFKNLVPEVAPEREDDAQLLNGPKLDGADGHVSQDDIDALFT